MYTILQTIFRSIRFIHYSTAKRIKATDEEKKKYKFKKKGSAYFLKLIFTIPGKAVAKKAIKKVAKK